MSSTSSWVIKLKLWTLGLILREYCEYPEDEFTENIEIVKDLHINSLDIMLLVGDLEAEYGIVFDEEELKDIVTVGDFAELLLKKINKHWYAY